MRIAFNALPAVVGSGPVFYRNILPELARLKNDHELLILVRADQREVIEAVPPELHTVALEAPRNFMARFVWEQAVLPRWLRENRIDVLYAQQTTALFAQCKRVLTINGANPYSALDFDFSMVDRVKHHVIRLVGKVSARVSDRVLFVSENSRSLIAPRLHSVEQKTAVVPFGVHLPEDRLLVQADDDFILTVSVLWPHKNYVRLMDAFELLVADGYTGQLVIAGAAHDQRYATRLYAHRDKLHCRKQIIFTDRLSAEQLDELYRRARLFVFPSLEETQGLPLLEAMSYGLPIAASDCTLSPQGQHCFSPFREFAGDSAIYFDPFRPEAIAEALSELLGDPVLCQELSARGRERAAEFSWRRTAEETLRVFAELAPHA